MRDILFVGALGLGMRPLLQLVCSHQPKIFDRVFASDQKTDSCLRQELGKEIIWVDHRKPLHELKKEQTIEDLVVVYSTEIPAGHPQRTPKDWVLHLHRAQLLASLVSEKSLVSVMGTHGKTSTTALLANLLSSKKTSFYCGEAFTYPSLKKKLRAHWGEGETFVCEVDESDGSFTHLCPQVVILTNFDGDHLELWERDGQRLSLSLFERKLYESLTESDQSPAKKQIEVLSHYLERVQPQLIWCMDCPVLQKVIPKLSLQLSPISYGYSPQAQIRIDRRREKASGEHFVLSCFENVDWSMKAFSGKHQVSNAAAALIASSLMNEKSSVLQKQLLLFQGVDRRMQLLYREKAGSMTKNPRMIFDDYAHHPLEVQTTLQAFLEKNKSSNPLVTVVFEPHRSQRLLCHYEGFCSAFRGVQEVCLMHPFQPKKLDTQKKLISLDQLADDIGKQSKTSCSLLGSFEDAKATLIEKKEGVCIFMGAGQVSQLAHQVAQAWRASETVTDRFD